MIVPILRQTPYNFSFLSGGAFEEIPIANMVPVAGAQAVSLSVRIHSANIVSMGSYQLLVYGQNDARMDGQEFVTSSTIGSTSTITSASPNLVSLSAIIRNPVQPFVKVTLKAQSPVGGGGNLYAELSADLVVRKVECGCDEVRLNAEKILPPAPRRSAVGFRSRNHCSATSD